MMDNVNNTTNNGNGNNDQPSVQEFFNLSNPGPETLFAVTPKSWCKHLQNLIETKPECFQYEAIDISAPCDVCGDTSENWYCLDCHKIFCGRYVQGHMLRHNQDNHHNLTISIADISCWCYGCEYYIHNPILIPIKNVIHMKKFGQPIPT